MHRVRSYSRRDGVRVRSHYRRGRGRRSTVRFLRDRDSSGLLDGLAGWALLAALPVLLLVVAIVRFVERHPVWSGLIGVSLAAVGVAVLRAWLRVRARQQTAEEEVGRSVAATDTMAGEQFEQWVADLLTRSGCTGVRVCGRTADRGADIVGHTPDGRRLVVQCKRQGWNNPVGSAAIQRFAGTCRTIHRGEVCMIVTNGRFTAGDGAQLARELDIVLVDRSVLGGWAAHGVVPVRLGTRLAPTPGAARLG
ncbi:restriction endonuclease [Micromonospora sp. NBC_01796]|uniref:restriction endonuclease n=1 Tax=Micromonospora sp. NBC_01796 TaxID=2975987 RepID=UPI002DDB2222|nr:restriction endonuclease [Micromonospora sp. NBC_01796]WSA86501.1 restriction endonuclease [Micromonospora sp. NBC_01796]